jgi:iron complex outermembrane recepter protein
LYDLVCEIGSVPSRSRQGWEPIARLKSSSPAKFANIAVKNQISTLAPIAVRATVTGFTLLLIIFLIKVERSIATPTSKSPGISHTRGAKSGQQLVQTTGAAIEITGVKLRAEGSEIAVILETAGQITPSAPQAIGSNTVYYDIPNVKLAQPFRATNPAAGIASVSVSQIDAGYVRVVVTGSNNSAPQARVIATAGGTNPEAAQTNEAELEVKVVGSGPLRNKYRQPDTSTATGTNTPLIDTPVSAQVIPQAVIRDKQATEIKEAVGNVSGVFYRGDVQGRSGNTFIVRGFEDVQILRDGIRRFGGGSSESNAQPAVEIANLEKIEVIKGPASILYGSIEPGGLINLVSKQPLATPFREAEVQFGSRGLIRPRIDLSGPIDADGKVLYRFNGLYQSLGNFRNLTQNEQKTLLSPTVTWKIDNRTSLNVSSEYIDVTRPADFGIPSANGKVVDVPRDRVITDPNDRVNNKSLFIGYRLDRQLDDNWQLSNAFRYTATEYGFDVVSLPLSYDATTNTVGRVFAAQDSQTRNYTFQTNVTGKLTTGDIKHTVLVGFDYVNRNSNIFSRVDATTRPLDIFNPVYDPTKPSKLSIPPFGGDEVTANNWGFFLQDQVDLTKNLKLLAGARFDTLSLRTVNLPGESTVAGESNISATAFTPRVGLLYKLGDNLSLYGSYSQSFTPNTATTATGTPLDPQRGKGYDFGIKADLLDNKLFATLAYFDITKQNVPNTDPTNPLFSIAIGEQRSKGLEFDLSGEIAPGLKLIGSYAYIDGKITADTDAVNVGKRLFGTPEHSASLWTTYELQSGDLQGLGFGFGFNFIGARFGDNANTYTLDSYVTADAAIFYKRNDWRFGLNFKNIGDVKYIDSSFGNAAAGNTFGAPFTVISSVSVTF